MRDRLNIAAVRLTRDGKRERAGDGHEGTEERQKWIPRMAAQLLFNTVHGFKKKKKEEEIAAWLFALPL